MVKHTQTIRRLFPTSCLSVFDRFVRLALKGLTDDSQTKKYKISCQISSINRITKSISKITKIFFTLQLLTW